MRIVNVAWIALCVVLLPVQIYAAGNSNQIRADLLAASLTVTMSCESAVSTNPLISLTITNAGSKEAIIPNEGVYSTIDLVVKDQSGNSIPPKSGRDWDLFSVGDRILPPGQSLKLQKYISAMAPISQYPISDWGYRGLASGIYSITAAAAKPAKAASVSQCTVNVR